ncbi:hypothetical protein OVA14_02730 [Agrococcus sp. SL85]|uniref:hypothetical protein n=1 Tax=Agrococcus sp. SL85 TaxID=2995141 RepID=UPI00226CF8FA|nr:hypothetical protein [Agrococcus sp. SL85]WAC66710.1 hypothetical protein OVA14_02730 [Agrococcus sp. SL85]
MAYDDIDIPLRSMETLSTALGDIVAEFDDATGRSEALEAAIGTPLGRGGLRDQAQEFEEAWDDKRDTLKAKLERLKERVDDTRTAWEDLDVELATASEVQDGNDG